jgi:hypothetical protein
VEREGLVVDGRLQPAEAALDVGQGLAQDRHQLLGAERLEDHDARA